MMSSRPVSPVWELPVEVTWSAGTRQSWLATKIIVTCPRLRRLSAKRLPAVACQCLASTTTLFIILVTPIFTSGTGPPSCALRTTWSAWRLPCAIPFVWNVTYAAEKVSGRSGTRATASAMRSGAKRAKGNANCCRVAKIATRNVRGSLSSSAAAGARRVWMQYALIAAAARQPRTAARFASSRVTSRARSVARTSRPKSAPRFAQSCQWFTIAARSAARAPTSAARPSARISR